MKSFKNRAPPGAKRSAKSGMSGSTCGDVSQRPGSGPRACSVAPCLQGHCSCPWPGQRGLTVPLPAIRRHSARDCLVSTEAFAQLRRLISDFADPLRSTSGHSYHSASTYKQSY
jgi:hypothetical protein